MFVEHDCVAAARQHLGEPVFFIDRRIANPPEPHASAFQ
jgi:hypothetical protein